MKMNKILVTVTALVFALTAVDAASARERTRTTTGKNGRSVTVNKDRVRTDKGSFSNTGTYTRTGANGETRSGSYTGTSDRTKTEDGFAVDKSGEVTTGKGNTYNVDANSSYSYSTDNGWQRTGNTSVTNSSGEVVRTTSGSADVTDSGLVREGTVTGRKGNTYNVDSTTTKGTEGGLTKSSTVTNSAGEVVGGSTKNATYEYIPGQGWVKTVSGTTQSGETIERTTTNSPTP